MGLFEKKYCDVCGEKIRLLGNRKLEDANLCKNCASRLSPWFNERRHSTLEEIKAQLEYREENREAVRVFHPTLSYGRNTKVLIDEDAGKFVVTSARDLEEANPDVIDFSQVTGCDLEISEGRNEIYRKDQEGKNVSFEPKRYEYYYNFHIRIRVRHDYFDEIRFQLNGSPVKTGEQSVKKPAVQQNAGNVSGILGTVLNPFLNAADTSALFREYHDYEQMGNEIRSRLLQGRADARDNAGPQKVTCPHCMASTVPDENGCCEFCGGSLKG